MRLRRRELDNVQVGKRKTIRIAAPQRQSASKLKKLLCLHGYRVFSVSKADSPAFFLPTD